MPNDHVPRAMEKAKRSGIRTSECIYVLPKSAQLIELLQLQKVSGKEDHETKDKVEAEHRTWKHRWRQDSLDRRGGRDGELLPAYDDKALLSSSSYLQPNLPPGDVILRLRVRPHHAFRAGPPGSRDLYYTASITLSESLLGFQRVLFYHLDGRGIKVDCPTGERIIKHGDTFFIKGEGMPKNASTRNRAGDLYVRFEVEMPDLDWVKRQQAQSGPEVSSRFAAP